MRILHLIRRFYLHFYRYKSIVGIIAIIMIMGMAFYGLIYPGEENLETYVSYLGVLGTIEIDNPGFHFWIILAFNLLLTIFLPILAIYLGVNILPFSEKEGREYLFSTSKSNVKFFLENALLVVIILFLVTIPVYLMSIGFLYFQNSIDSLKNITISLCLSLVLAIFTMFLSAVACTFNFSKSSGIKIGGGYFVFSFLIDQTRTIENSDIIRLFSLYSQAEITLNSFRGTWNVEFIIFTILLIIIAIIFLIILLFRKDYLEGGIRTKKDEKIQEEKEKIVDRISFIRKPVEVGISKIGWKFPALRDQLHSNAGLFTIFLVFMSLISIYMVMIFFQSGEEGINIMIANLDQPILNAGMFNYRFDPSSMNSLSYILAIELLGYGWMSFGVFLLVVVYDIVARDYRNGYSETTWMLPRTGTNIFLGRIIAAIVYLVIIFTFSLFSILIGEIIFDSYTELTDTILGYFTLTWAYCVILVFFVALTLFFPHRHAIKIIAFGFFFSILMIFVGFMSEFSLLIYLSPFGYFDFLGVFLGQISVLDFLPTAIVGTLLTLAFFVYVLKKRLPLQDYMA